MTISLDHHALKADLEGAARALGLTLNKEESEEAGENGRIVRQRVLEARLPRPSTLRARFAHEGLAARLKKLFHDEVEVGKSQFDNHVYVVTSTREATRQWLTQARVQTALMLLVLPTRYVEVLGDVVRVVDEDAQRYERDVAAELLALAALAAP